ncbi:class I SAM-dependent methyltransferase [Bacteriovoracaceae bacterium]|nr:class I SAM-dependent methyltransferase [Bacteriovoracaceae bacterium]
MINTFQIERQEPIPLESLIDFLQLGQNLLDKYDLPKVYHSPVSMKISRNSGGTTIEVENGLKVSLDLNDDFRRLFQEVNKVQNKKYPLYRVLRKFNISSDEKREIIDCTAGFLGDSLLLLILYPSLEVTAFEFNPLLFILLTDSLEKSSYKQLKKLKLRYGSSIDYLQQNEVAAKEIYYCDPMFEVKSLKSKNKKKIQFLEALIEDKNQQEFLPLLKGKNFIFKTSTLNHIDTKEYPIHFKEVGKNVTYYIFIAN